MTRIEVSDPTALERDVSLRYAVEVPRYAEPANGGLSFTPFGAAATYVQGYAALSARKTDLVLGWASARRFRHEVTLPEGLSPSLPPPVEEEGPFGSLRVAYRMDGPRLVVEGQVILGTPRIEPKDYPAFRAFLGRVDRALSRRVVLAPAAAVEAEPRTGPNG